MNLRFRPEQIEVWPLDRLAPYPGNARRHEEEQVALIAASMAEFGWTVPVLVAADGEVIAGHGRVLAARRLGLQQVPVIVLDHLSETDRRAYRLADNKLTELAPWDEALLAEELHALNGEGRDLSLTGFDDAELERLMAPLGDDEETDGDGPASVDDADETPEPPRDPVTRPGDLWLLGGHRLLCGDSTDPAVVAQVMAGETAALCFTSPPYAQQRQYTRAIGDWDALMRGVFGALPMAEAGQVLVNLGLVHRDGEWMPYWDGWVEWMRSQGWRRFAWYAWDQGPGLPGDWGGRLAPAFEFILHFNRKSRHPNKTKPCKWAGHVNGNHGGMRGADGTVGDWAHAGQGVQETKIPDSVVRVTRHKARGIEVEHPAVFPVALAEEILAAYSDANEICYEPFSGSGTGILAAERLGRRCRAIELAPEYVDLAILRWRKLFPGQPVTLEADGQSFPAVAAERGIEVGDDDR